jgi:phosphoglycerate dehydrogenase-like enzyme
VEKPRIWFERPPLPDVLAAVEAVAVVVGSTGPGDDGLATLGEADAAMAGARAYDAAFMDRGPRLKVICRTGIGYDKVDVAAATLRGIAVCNTPDGPTISTAEHAVALMLSAAKLVKRSEGWLREGQTNLFARHQAVELDGKALGLVGFGRIARRVATAARGLGMTVLAYDPYLADDAFAGVDRTGSLEALLAASDVVSVHIPLTADNAGLFGAERFGQMKPGAVFVNTARGGLVEQEALVEALDSGRLHSAGLDVTDPEPLPTDHPLFARDDVVVTPHVASGTVAGKRRMFRMALEQVVDVLAGRRPAHLLNPEAWDLVKSRVDGESS